MKRRRRLFGFGVEFLSGRDCALLISLDWAGVATAYSQIPKPQALAWLRDIVAKMEQEVEEQPALTPGLYQHLVNHGWTPPDAGPRCLICGKAIRDGKVIREPQGSSHADCWLDTKAKEMGEPQ